MRCALSSSVSRMAASVGDCAVELDQSSMDLVSMDLAVSKVRTRSVAEV